MVTPTATVDIDVEQARDELVRELPKRRSAGPPHELARQLPEYDQPGHTTLVGIDVDARRAVLYHERDRDAIAVTIGADGFADGGAKIAGFEYGPGIDSRVATMGAYLGWIRPRFRPA